MRTMTVVMLMSVLALPAGAAEVKRNLIDEGNLATLAAQFPVAWNHHDATAMVAFFTPDADVINPAGREAKGAAEIKALFEEEHAGVMKDSVLKATSRSIQWIRQDVVLTTWDATLRGMVGPDGKTLPTQTLIVSSVMVKVKEGKEEKWLCAASRPMAPLPSPKPPAAK
jgi:uncharacterized protein (TIGR02246 family)